MLARAVKSITFKNRVVTVVFDPKRVGLSVSDFQSLNSFDNLAEFAGTPLEFDDEQGIRLRPAIDRVVTELPNGTSLGSMTTAEIYVVA